MKIAVMVRHLNNFFNNGDTLPPTFVYALIFNRAPIDPNRPLVPPYDGLVRETDAKTLNHVMVRGVGTR
jgi:hypothetical protein